MSRLSDSLKSAQFTLTVELNPPKGTNLDGLFQKADSLKELVTAFNLTDSAASHMAMSPTAAAHLLADQGVESTLQVAGRDRNRLAIQADMLAAHALGVQNIVCMTGDPPCGGDHPDAMPVFDLGSADLLRAAVHLESGQDMAGRSLNGSPSFFRGAVANVAVPDLSAEIARMAEKVEAGAQFFQTNAVYDVAEFEAFMKEAGKFGLPVLAGIILLKSPGQARHMTAKIPGIVVPDELIEEMEGSDDRVRTGVEIAGRIVREVASMCNGVHIMAIGWENRIPDVLDLAGVAPVPV